MQLTDKELAKLVRIARCKRNEANGKPKSSCDTLTWISYHIRTKADKVAIAALVQKGAVLAENGIIQLTNAGFQAYAAV